MLSTVLLGGKLWIKKRGWYVIVELISRLVSFITSIINQLGYFGIALGMFIESACIPLPSELVLPGLWHLYKVKNPISHINSDLPDFALSKKCCM